MSRTRTDLSFALQLLYRVTDLLALLFNIQLSLVFYSLPPYDHRLFLSYWYTQPGTTPSLFFIILCSRRFLKATVRQSRLKRSPSRFSCGASIFVCFYFELYFIPYDQIFSSTEVGTLSTQEFPYRVVLSLSCYYTIIETFFELQKYQYNRMFWDQHKFLFYVLVVILMDDGRRVMSVE